MEELDNSIKRIAKGSGIIFIGIVLSKILSYVYRVIIARMGVQEYGLFSIGLAVTSFLAIVTSLGLSEGVVRYVSYFMGKKEESKARNVIKSSLIITGTLSVIVAILLANFSKWISINFFHDATLTLILALFAIALPLDVVKKIILSIIRAFQKTEYEVYSKNIIENLAKILFTVFLIYMGFGILGVVIGYILAFIISLVVAAYFLKKVFSLKGKTTKLPKKEIIYYSLPLLFANFMVFIMGWIDTFMLSYFKTSTEVGLYNAALPIAQIQYLFPYALSFLFLPIISTLFAQNKKEALKPIYKTITKWVFLINLAILSMFILFPKQIISTMFGQKYLITTILFGKEVLPVPLSLTILAIGLFCGYLMTLGTNFFLVIKKTKLMFYITFVIALLNTILNYFLIQKYGVIGAATATSISFFAMGLLLLILVKSILKIWPFKKVYFNIIFAAILSILVTYLFKRILDFDKDVYILLVGGILFTITYALTIIFTKSLEKKDVMILRLIQEKTNINIKPLNKLLKRFT